MKKSGIILDLDDTLFDSVAAYSHALTANGIDPESKLFLQARTLVKKRLPMHATNSHCRFLYFKSYLELSQKFSSLELLNLYERYNQALSTHIAHQWQKLNRDSIISWLVNNHQVVVLTNETAKQQITKLAAVDPNGRFFRNILTSEELGIEKPATVAFTEAAARIDRNISECVAIGNNFAADVEPAIKLGARGILTREFSETRDVTNIPANVHVIEKLSEITELL